MDYNEVKSVILVVKTKDIPNNAFCEICRDTINKRKFVYAIAYPTEKYFSDPKLCDYFHVHCILKKIQNPRGADFIAELGYSRCQICGNKVNKNGVLLGKNTLLKAHKICLIASIYRQMKIKLPKKIESELVMIDICD